MSKKSTILLQLDGDSQPSSFDAIVAVDAGIDRLISYGNVSESQVEGLTHGAIFTRGPADLKSTAIFVGGSDVAVGEALLARVVNSFFGPLRVSVMMDANGANTTAAAAVLAAAAHLALSEVTAVVLAATGPVGQRIARLLARQGAAVRVASRRQDRAAEVADTLQAAIPDARVAAFQASNEAELHTALGDAHVVFAAGAAGVQLLPCGVRQTCSDLQVAIDLNAVPPLGLEGIEPTDSGVHRDGVVCYGAIGVGGTKMRIHRAALQHLFERNDAVLDAEEIFAIGQSL